MELIGVLILWGHHNKSSSKSDCDVRSHANVKLHNERSQIVRLLPIIPDCCFESGPLVHVLLQVTEIVMTEE